MRVFPGGLGLLVAGISAIGCGPDIVDTEYDAFGHLSANLIAYKSFDGSPDPGLGPGPGLRISMPPLFPLSVAAVGTLLVVPAVVVTAAGEGSNAAFGQTLDAIAEPVAVIAAPGLVSGTRAGNTTVVELSLELSYEASWHEDTLFGGEMAYDAWLLGIRLGGPEEWIPSFYLSAGWGWYGFEFDNRPTAAASGAYIGGGLQLFLSEQAKLSLGFTRSFYSRVDGGTPPDEGSSQALVGITGAWYF